MTTNRQQQINNLSSIKLLEQRTLSSKSTLYIIEIESERLLIGESAAGIALLASLSKEEESTVSTSS